MAHKFDPDKHHRRSIRLQGYDYSQAGAYFVTVVAHQRECLFGDVVGGGVVLNEFGRVVANTWEWLENQYSYVALETWVVMPNHFHGILLIQDDGRGGSRTAPTPMKRKPLGRLIGAFKTVSTKQINLLRDTPGIPIWQRNYYEHVIRNDDDLNRIHRYIESNPSMWADDDENPSNLPV